MLVIVDYRVPKEAVEKLSQFGKVDLFDGSDITYSAVEGHPDIFMFQSSRAFVIAPNTPKKSVEFLDRIGVEYIVGERAVGMELNNSTQYNLTATDRYLFHKSGSTDKTVLELHSDLEFVNLPQAYARCSMFAINDSVIVTSDMGIYKALDNYKNIECLYLDPKQIKLPPYSHGFIGGCLGKVGDRIVVMGDLNYIDGGDMLKTKIESLGLSVVELYDGALYDCGGIFFIDSE